MVYTIYFGAKKLIKRLRYNWYIVNIVPITMTIILIGAYILCLSLIVYFVDLLILFFNI